LANAIVAVLRLTRETRVFMGLAENAFADSHSLRQPSLALAKIDHELRLGKPSLMLAKTDLSFG